jgi:hypothetical protein
MLGLEEFTIEASVFKSLIYSPRYIQLRDCIALSETSPLFRRSNISNY